MPQHSSVANLLPPSLVRMAGHLRDLTESQHVAFGQWIHNEELVVTHWPKGASTCFQAWASHDVPDPWRAVTSSGGAILLNEPHHWLTHEYDLDDARVNRSIWVSVRYRQQLWGILSLAERYRPYSYAEMQMLESAAQMMGELLSELDAHHATVEELRVARQEARLLREQLQLSEERCQSAVASLEECAERVRSIQEIETRASVYQAVLNAIPDVVYLKGEAGYQFINTRYESLFGVTNDQVQDLTDAEIFADFPALVAQFRQNDEYVRRTGETLRTEEVAPHPDGPHHYSTVKFPVRDREGRITAVAGISTDITESSDKKRLVAELMQAEKLQKHLYPAAAPELEGFEIFGATVAAAEVCGDYYDFIPLADGSVVVALGDVCGHDLPAAMWMIATRSYLRGLLRHPAGLGEIVENLDALVSMDLDVSKFVSLFLVHITPSTRQIAYSAAGHDGVILRATGEEEILHSEDMMLGIECQHRSERTTKLRSGDLLILWTDGIHESTDIHRRTLGRRAVLDLILERRLCPLPEIFTSVYQSATNHRGMSRLGDDATMVLIRAKHSADAPE